MHSRIVAAVDIGGTKVAAALVNPLTGEILTQRQDPTNTGSPQAFVDGVAGALAKVLDQAPSPFPAAIGVGTRRTRRYSDWPAHQLEPPPGELTAADRKSVV